MEGDISNLDNYNVCKYCFKPFKNWIREHECAMCEEGTQEIEHDFGEGSSFVRCRSCNGLGLYYANETMFCTEDCLVDYMQDQYEEN